MSDDLPGMWEEADYLYGKTDAEEETELRRRIPGATLGTAEGTNGIPPQNFFEDEAIQPPDIAEMAAAWCTAQFVADHTVTALDGYMAGFKACEDIYEGRA